MTTTETGKVTGISGEIITSLRYGWPVRFFVQDKLDVIQSHHVIGQFYEEQELDIICRNFPPGGVYLDVGAHVGNHLIYLSRKKLASELICVEPNPLAIQILVPNLLLNGIFGSVDLGALGLGLSDGAQTARMNIPYSNNLGASQVLEEDDGPIKLIAGDSIFENRRVNFIKIDVVGHEMRVLRGLINTISRCRPVIFIDVNSRNTVEFLGWIQNNRYLIVERFQRYADNENYLIRPE